MYSKYIKCFNNTDLIIYQPPIARPPITSGPIASQQSKVNPPNPIQCIYSRKHIHKNHIYTLNSRHSNFVGVILCGLVI